MSVDPTERLERLGPLDAAVNETLVRVEKEGFCRRLWDRDPRLWKSEPEHQRIIKNSLGWLCVVDTMLEQVAQLRSFVVEVNSAGFRHAVLLGMGGSSLCPEVCRATFGTAPGYPELQVLDSTVPASVLRVEDSTDLAQTLFLVSSKSGGTVETTSFYKYFYGRVRAVKSGQAGENFVAITDPGTSLEKLARARNFRRVFHGQPDIGGRFSALSNFGMLPAALAGVDVGGLLARAREVADDCATELPPWDNLGVYLGVVLVEAALAGRDKITFVMSPGIRTFGDWVEQLIAESTGKEGKGILPVVGEQLGNPDVYGDDRVFVHLKLISEASAGIETKLRALAEAGHPVLQFELRDKLDLGGEFFRWEVATATAGALLGINPFDQPNVQESKDNTNRLLGQFSKTGKLPEDTPALESDGLKFYGVSASGSAAERVAAFLAQATPGDYIALLAYVVPAGDYDAILHSVRTRLRDAMRVATTLGYGPRYLHSTGQLHKGGANNGLFIEITADDEADLPVPGEPYNFSALKQAQALGDLESLRSKGRRAVQIHLGKDIRGGLERLLKTVESALSLVARARAAR